MGKNSWGFWFFEEGEGGREGGSWGHVLLTIWICVIGTVK